MLHYTSNNYWIKWTIFVTDGSGNLSFSTVSETKPTVADVSQTIAPSSATTINITGSNFVSVPIVQFINGSTGAVLTQTQLALQALYRYQLM